jgi:magnesium chelatase family protein
LIPTQSRDKISLIPEIEIYCVNNLKEAIEFFKNSESREERLISNIDIGFDYLDILDKKYYYQKKSPLDFLDIKGQEIAKRVALIASAGGHNMLMEGSPGCGKSMLSKRLPYILPPLSLEEILQNAKIDTLDGKNPTFEPIRNFRSPHHSSTSGSLFGGGSKNAKMGEVALAHNGVLFFDEFPMFEKKSIDSLREPLENYEILISRVNSKINYPTKFIFVAAQNPCPCGNLLSSIKECRCSELEIKRYKNKISEPVLDRIDLFVQMQESSSEDKPSISTTELRNMVFGVFEIQLKRGQKELNGRLSEGDLELFCILNSEAKDVLEMAIKSFSLSHRATAKAIKVARTIADLRESNKIEKVDILEALSYRKR